MTIEQASALKPGDQFKATDNVWEDPVYTVLDNDGDTVSVSSSTEVGPPQFSYGALEGYSLLGDVPVAPKKKK